MNQPAPAPTGSLSRKIKRSLSFQGSAQKAKANAEAAAGSMSGAMAGASAATLADATTVESPARRISAKEFAAGANVHAVPLQEQPTAGGRPLQGMRRASSFGRSPAKPSAIPSGLPPQPDISSLLEHRKIKQDIAASQLQRYLSKMTEIDPTPEADMEVRPARQLVTRTDEDDTPRLEQAVRDVPVPDVGIRADSMPATRRITAGETSVRALSFVSNSKGRPTDQGESAGPQTVGEQPLPSSTLPADFCGHPEVSEGALSDEADDAVRRPPPPANSLPGMLAEPPAVPPSPQLEHQCSGTNGSAPPPPPPPDGGMPPAEPPPLLPYAPPPPEAPLPKRPLNLFRAPGQPEPSLSTAVQTNSGDVDEGKALSLRRRSTVDTASGVTIIGGSRSTAVSSGSMGNTNALAVTASNNARGQQPGTRATLHPPPPVMPPSDGSGTQQLPSVVDLKDLTPAADGRSLSLPIGGVKPSSPSRAGGSKLITGSAAVEHSPGIRYTQPAFGNEGRVVPPNGVKAAPEARAAPEMGLLSKETKPSSGAGGTTLATGLKKRLSFGRSAKKEQPPPKLPGATPTDVQLRSGPSSQPAKSPPASGGSNNRSPKQKLDGEMDDDELERYLRDLELNHDRERTEFESTSSPL